MITDRLILIFPGAHLVIRGDECYVYPLEKKEDSEHSDLGYVKAHDGAVFVALEKIDKRVRAALQAAQGSES